MSLKNFSWWNILIAFFISVASLPSLQKDDSTPVAEEFKTILDGMDRNENDNFSQYKNVPFGEQIGNSPKFETTQNFL